jgi:4-amino-4-deoxy-L-arabinose transferase-like glycosyltransferase
MGERAFGAIGQSADSAAPGRLSRTAWAILLAYSGSLMLFALGSARTLTGHEGHLAQVAQEMLDRGDWIVPRIAGRPWLQKPPLPHWCMAGAAWLAGELNAFTVRLPSALCGLLGVCLIASLAARWYGSTHGLLVGLIQSTTIYTVTYARLAESDIYLWVIVLFAIWIFARHEVGGTRQRAHWIWPATFCTVLGLTNMAKGPLFGMVLALAPCAAFVVLARRWQALRWFLSPLGIALAALIALAWPLAILLQHPDAWPLWVEHTFGRLLSQTALNPKPVWYYLTTWPWQTLPWTVLALLAMPASAGRAWRDPVSPDRFLWLWCLLPLLLLSIPSGKHHHYLIYALPPFAFWAADGLLRLRDLAVRLERRVPLAAAVFTVVLLLAVLGVVALRVAWPAYWLEGALLAFVAVAALATLLAQLVAGYRRSAVVAVFVVIWVFAGLAHGVWLPKQDSYATETAFLQRMKDLAVSGERLVIYRIEPSRALLYCEGQLPYCTLPEELRRICADRTDLIILSSLARETELREVGQVTRIDEAPCHPRRGRGATWAAYRMTWAESDSTAGR